MNWQTQKGKYGTIWKLQTDGKEPKTLARITKVCGQTVYRPIIFDLSIGTFANLQECKTFVESVVKTRKKPTKKRRKNGGHYEQ